MLLLKLMINYLVEGFQELKGSGLLAILVENLVEPRHNLCLPETCHLCSNRPIKSNDTQRNITGKKNRSKTAYMQERSRMWWRVVITSQAKPTSLV
jgi:hypothetical protein